MLWLIRNVRKRILKIIVWSIDYSYRLTIIIWWGGISRLRTRFILLVITYSWRWKSKLCIFVNCYQTFSSFRAWNFMQMKDLIWLMIISFQDKFLHWSLFTLSLSWFWCLIWKLVRIWFIWTSCIMTLSLREKHFTLLLDRVYCQW